MTVDSLLTFFIVAALVYVLCVALPNRSKRKYEKLAREEMNALYEAIGPQLDEYLFFGRGHPYVWTEFSKETAEDIVVRSCEIRPYPGCPFSLYDLSKNHLYSSHDLKHIYIVPRGETDETSNLLHYQQWIDSHKEIGENIARYKKNS
jgi:hypothetical protein